MTKEYLKMADVFPSGGVVTRSTLSANIQNGTALILHGEQAEYAAHSINSRDELVAEAERLRGIISEIAQENERINLLRLNKSK